MIPGKGAVVKQVAWVCTATSSRSRLWTQAVCVQNLSIFCHCLRLLPNLGKQHDIYLIYPVMARQSVIVLHVLQQFLYVWNIIPGTGERTEREISGQPLKSPLVECVEASSAVIGNLYMYMCVCLYVCYHNPVFDSSSLMDCYLQVPLSARF